MSANKSPKRINPFLFAIVALLIVVLLVSLIVPKASQATPTLLIWIIGISVLAIIILIVPFCFYEINRTTGNRESENNSTIVSNLEEPQNTVETTETKVVQPTVSKFKKVIDKLKHLRKSKK